MVNLMIKRRLIAALILTTLNVASGNGYGADLRSLIEPKENGAIDWTAGVVEAKGTGVPTTYTYSGKQQTSQQQTLAQATKKAQHNLLETIVNLRINSESRVIDVVETYPSIMAQLRGMVQTAPEIEKLRQYQYDGTVEVWSQMKLNGGFSQLILPPEIRHIESIKQVLPPPNYSRTQSRLRSSQIFSGLVVDARSLRAVPVLAPRILDENLEEVFGPAYVSREFAVQHGSPDRQSPESSLAGTLRFYHQQCRCRQTQKRLRASQISQGMPGHNCAGSDVKGQIRLDRM
jgi:hypothetical protein